MSELPDGPWSISQGTYDDKPLIARINTGAQSIAGVPTLPHRIGVAVLIREPDASGMPGSGESAQLNALEDALCAALGCGHRSVHVVTLTTAGFREFVFHTSVPDLIAEAITEVRMQHPHHEIQFIQESDPEWNVFRQFVS